MKGRCPRPLDERDNFLLHAFSYFRVRRLILSQLFTTVNAFLRQLPSSNSEKSYCNALYINQINLCGHSSKISFRKEVIQRQVPLALPCYDFTPVMNHKVASVLPKVKLPASFAAHSHGVTGGVYKARERIHRGILIHDY